MFGQVVTSGWRRSGLRCCISARGRCRRFAAELLVATIATATLSQYLHSRAFDFGCVTVSTFLVLPLARADASLDIQRRTLAQVFAGDFSEAAVENDAMPFGDFPLLAAGLVLPFFGRRQANITDGIAVRCVAGFRVVAKVADKDYFREPLKTPISA